MRILIVAATVEEVMPLISDLRLTVYDLKGNTVEPDILTPEAEIVNLKPEMVNTYNTAVLITGVGMVATAFALGRHLAAHNYNLVVNLGIAGSFDRTIVLGELVEITSDTFAELGAEDDTNFLTLDEMGFGQAAYEPTTKLTDLYNLFNTFNLKQASAITVNKVHGNEASINVVAARLHPQVESMEGAAFFYACKQMDVPCIQIRAVSNYVEKRNRANWNIGLAIKKLNTFAVEFVKLYA
jgi:futalosine hydrolase